MSEYVRCVGCGEIVEATEPCSCLFDVVGTLDAQGVLHTAERVAVRFAVPCCCCEELFEPDPQQVDDWGQSGRSFDPTDWQCPLCDAAQDQAWEEDLIRMREIEERAQLDAEHAAEWAVQQFVSQYGHDYWLDEGDRGEMAYRRINAREKAEFPHGEFDDGARWREPAQALSPLSPGQWACEPCGDPEWTEEALDAAVAHMDEVEERAWLDTERAAEWAVQQHVSQTRLTDEEEAVIGAQVDAWSDRGMAWEDIVALEPRAMLLPTR